MTELRAKVMAAGLICLAAIANAKDAMITQHEALEAAERALKTDVAPDDRMFTQWSALGVADPHVVHDVSGTPSYWIVGLASRGRIVGFARVTVAGDVAAIGITCQTPERPETCPTPVFALTAEEVEETFGQGVTLGTEERPEPALLVHDGPPGREAWLIETRRGGVPERWVFVGAGGVYERLAGSMVGEDSALE